MNNTYTTTANIYHVQHNVSSHRDMRRVIVPKAPHTITITSSEWHSLGSYLVTFLAEHIGLGNYKLRFAKNAAGQVLEGNSVDIEFATAEFELLFKLLTGSMLENVKYSYSY